MAISENAINHTVGGSVTKFREANTYLCFFPIVFSRQIQCLMGIGFHRWPDNRVGATTDMG